jgi:hypothetical protein
MHLDVKILGIKTPMRYAVRRAVASAEILLRAEYPDLEVEVRELKTEEEISKYTQVLIAPGLVINEKLVYDLWIPSKEMVVGWMREAIKKTRPV